MRKKKGEKRLEVQSVRGDHLVIRILFVEKVIRRDGGRETQRAGESCGSCLVTYIK